MYQQMTDGFLPKRTMVFESVPEATRWLASLPRLA